MTIEPSSRKWIFASLFAAILGITDTAILTAQHYRIAEQGLLQKSFCTFSSLIDCDTALTSDYAHLWRIPVSEMGLLFYVVIIVLLLWALNSTTRRRSILEYLLLVASIGTIYSLFMTYILTRVLGVICIFCSISHLLTVTIFIFLLAGAKAGPLKILTQRKAFVQYLIVSVLIYGVGIPFFFGLNKQSHAEPPKFDRQALLRHFYSQKPISFELPDAPSSGPERAPITIVDFSDFQCSYCRLAAFSLKPFLGEFRNQVRIVYLNYPLDNSCNPTAGTRHPAACIAAKAALCVFQEKGNDAFWEYHDLIFENQRKLSHTLLTKQLAPQIGMTEAGMGQCMIRAEIESRLAQDIRLGNENGIQSTPSIYINGRYLRSWAQPKILRAVIAAELKRVKGP